MKVCGAGFGDLAGLDGDGGGDDDDGMSLTTGVREGEVDG